MLSMTIQSPSLQTEIVDPLTDSNWNHFEIRELKTLEPSAPAAVAFLGHRLDLRRSEDELLGHLKSSVRRALRKGGRSDLKIEITKTREALLEYYQLHVLTRKKHG